MTIENNSRSKPSQAFIDALEKATQVLILTHHNPDGDALGSAVALALTMEQRGKKIALHLAGSWPENLDFLLPGFTQNNDFANLESYDLILFLDCHSSSRLGEKSAEALENALASMANPPTIAVIDHHPLEDGEDLKDTWFLVPETSSTGELAWGAVKALNWQAPSEALDAFLLAMSTDTNFFTQTNTSGETLRVASDLVDRGASLSRVNRRLRLNQPFRRLKLMGLALGSLELHFEGLLATMLVTPEFLAQAGATMSDTEDFVDMARSLAGVQIAALIKDSGEGPGYIRVSLRGNELDVRPLAQHFGGGGHPKAAAYQDSNSTTCLEARARLLAHAESYLTLRAN